jgi:osmotically-inducible protein OsmY
MDSERSRRWDSYEMRDQQFNPDAYRNSGMGASYDRGSWQPSDREQDYSGMRAGNREIRNNGELGGVYDSSRINRSNQGQFAGKGPKGYKRPDERIQEDVNEALSQHPDLDASELEVKVSQGEVVLTGTVSDRHAKRLAEDIAESCSGIQDVRNEIRVQRDHSSDDKESSHQNRKQPAMAGASKS